MRYTRRDVGKIALATLALPRLFRSDMFAAGSKINGVELGAITYSFRALPNASAVLDAMKIIGFTEVELMYNDAEQLLGAPKEPATLGPGEKDTPAQAAARRATLDALAAWRRAVATSDFAKVTAMFRRAGIEVRVLCHNFDVSHPDERIEYAFNMAKGLGVSVISTTTRVSVAPRIAPFAEMHKVRVGFHNHDWTDRPDEYATPESLNSALALSRYHGVNLDIGHFVAANFDPVVYITEHHDRITNLHVKDRKRNKGATVPFGQGDVPIKAVLQLLKKNRWDIPANIEFESDGDPIAETAKCLQYCKDALM